MRTRFVVITKLIGLLVLSWVPSSIGGSVRLLSEYSWALESGWLGPAGLGLFLSLVDLFVLIGIAWILIVRTQWLADKLNVPVRENSELGAGRVTELLTIGVKLVGLYVLAVSVTNLAGQGLELVAWSGAASRYAELGVSYPDSVTIARYVSIGVSLLKVALGLVYATGSGWLVRSIQGPDAVRAA